MSALAEGYAEIAATPTSHRNCSTSSMAQPASPNYDDCRLAASHPIDYHRKHKQMALALSVSEVESRRERIRARGTVVGSFPDPSCRPKWGAGVSDRLSSAVGNTEPLILGIARATAGNETLKLSQTAAAQSADLIHAIPSSSSIFAPLSTEMHSSNHPRVIAISNRSNSAAHGIREVPRILLGVMASLIGLRSCRRRPRTSPSRMPRVIDVCRCFSLMLAVRSSVAKYSNMDIHHNSALQSQSLNNCWNTQCGSSYQPRILQQTACDVGAFVYKFTVTSGTSQFQTISVNQLNLTCSNGKTLSQGDKPTTVNNIRQIVSATGFSYVQIAPGCIMDHMRIGGIDVGNVGYGNLSSCGCPPGESIIGLTQNFYDPNEFPSFSSFGVVCDSNFCSKGQYYSGVQCFSCPSGLKFVRMLIDYS